MPSTQPPQTAAVSTPLPASVLRFDVPSARALHKGYLGLNPGVRVWQGRSWTLTGGVPRQGLLERLGGLSRRAGAASTLWFWERDEDALRAQAGDVLLRFVHPLVADGRPYCVGFPFPAGFLEPRPLTLSERADLDLEDIGALLEAGAHPGPPAPSAQAPASSAHAGLDAAQRAAVRHGPGAARVLAAAGSGKTRTLVARVAELVARGVEPGHILLLAFNTKAAEQLEERLEEQGIATTRHIELGGTATAVHCATFNAFGARYQRDVARQRVQVDAGGSYGRALMRQALDEAGHGLPFLKPARGADPVGALFAVLARVRAGLEPPESITVPVLSTGDRPVVPVPFAAVHARYSHLQSLSGRQSFDDQIYFTIVDLLAAPARRRAVQRLYRHVLVDEFQDLNPAQLALIDVLSRPSRDLFVAGDDDQLIYGWRFADPAAILGFHERVPPAPLSATYALTTNYRCSRAVVRAAARLVANNSRREPKVMTAREGAQEGAVLFAAAPSWAERGKAVCAFLRAERARLGCAWSELAVLGRYRSQLFAVALTLDAEGVPRTPRLGCRLFTHPAARLVRACLALTAEPAPAHDAARGLLLRLLQSGPCAPGWMRSSSRFTPGSASQHPCSEG